MCPRISKAHPRKTAIDEALTFATFTRPLIQPFYNFCNRANTFIQTFALLRNTAQPHQQTFALLHTFAQKRPRNTQTSIIKQSETFAQAILHRMPAHKPQTRTSRLLQYCAGVTPKGG
jgi:hypothetical protein